MSHLDNLLIRLDACEEAREWAKSQPNLKTAWLNCKRSGWMIWLIARSTIDRDDPKLRLMACDFAEAVLHLVPKGENRPAEAVRIARLFAYGGATREEMDAAWAAAYAAVGAAVGVAARAAVGAAARDAQSNIIRKYYPTAPTIKKG